MARSKRKIGIMQSINLSKKLVETLLFITILVLLLVSYKFWTTSNRLKKIETELLLTREPKSTYSRIKLPVSSLDYTNPWTLFTSNLGYSIKIPPGYIVATVAENQENPGIENSQNVKISKEAVNDPYIQITFISAQDLTLDEKVLKVMENYSNPNSLHRRNFLGKKSIEFTSGSLNHIFVEHNGRHLLIVYPQTPELEEILQTFEFTI